MKRIIFLCVIGGIFVAGVLCFYLQERINKSDEATSTVTIDFNPNKYICDLFPIPLSANLPNGDKVELTTIDSICPKSDKIYVICNSNYITDKRNTNLKIQFRFSFYISDGKLKMSLISIESIENSSGVISKVIREQEEFIINAIENGLCPISVDLGKKSKDIVNITESTIVVAQ